MLLCLTLFLLPLPKQMPLKIKIKIDSSLQRPDLDFLLSLGQQELETLQQSQALWWSPASRSNVA